jgi:hypothetical protein
MAAENKLDEDTPRAQGDGEVWLTRISGGKPMIGPTSDGGDRLRVFLDGTHVETRWIADYHVIWQTGQRNGPPEGDPAHHTHCSAYVAAAALYLDIYILRPPNHKQLRLANAQVTWLGGGGSDPGPTAAASGWSALGASGGDGVLDAAVTAANLGKLVVAGYFQPPTQQSDGTTVQLAGHIVVVRPQDSFPFDEGPQVVTAGVKNFKSASMRYAFGDHPLAWPNNIQLFVHNTALE